MIASPTFPPTLATDLANGTNAVVNLDNLDPM